ncbi:hypothetical protein ACJIZ3_019354 [Penstemon smallii]|uniref:AT-hook motif nuclear-localized protein n=1 Tax=Penstemon smallii TaxID=265156 RepID=A0ABD3T0Y1_9LAMI
MSGSTEAATAAMTNHEASTVAPNSPAPAETPAGPSQPPQLEQNMLVPYGDPTYRAETSLPPPPPPPSHLYIPPGAVLIRHVNSGDNKRKRGRPRKYVINRTMASGNQPISVPLPENITPTSQPMENQTPVGGPMASGTPLSETTGSHTTKKARGRPLGSTNKKEQKEVTGSIDTRMKGHILIVNVGEDVASKIMAFSQHTPKTVCILSANGVISNIKLRQSETFGRTVIYEGRYDIVGINGSFRLSNSGGPNSRTGGISISLCGHERKIFGGCVAGFMLAATPVQEPKSAHKEPSSAPPRANQLGGSCSESSGGDASPFSGAYNIVPRGMPWG